MLFRSLKDVDEKLDVPPLKPELRQFVDWVSNYTLASRGMVLRMALRMGEHLGPGRERIGVRLGGPAPERMTAARARVLRLLANGLTLLKSEAAHEAGVSVGVVDGLIDAGALETIALPPGPVAPQPDPEFRKPELSLAQLAAADALRTTVAQGGYSVTLLDGVTGSGKTEVYFEGVAENIRRNRQTLILMMWMYWPRGTLRLWPLSIAAANKVAAPMLDAATRRLHGDSSRNAKAAATQFKPQAKASSTTNSLAVVAGSAFVRAGMTLGESGGGRRCTL